MRSSLTRDGSSGKKFHIPHPGLIKTAENSRALAAAMAGVAAAALCLLVLPSIHGFAKDPVQAGAVPVTLAGAGTEAGTQGGRELSQEKLRDQQTSEMLRSVLDGVKQTAPYSAPSPVDAQQSQSLSDAAGVGYAALSTVAKNQKMSFNDYSTLVQIVEAECTGGDEKSKLLVANVVLNRTRDSRFPDTVYDVVWQRVDGEAQFSPTQDGRIGTLDISQSTLNAVNRAVEGEDISKGALFFMARKYSAQSSVEWFDSNLQYLFSYGGHDFYTFGQDQAQGQSQQETQASSQA